MQKHCSKCGVKGAVVKPSTNIVEHCLFRKNILLTEMAVTQQLKPSSKTVTQNCSGGMIGGAAQNRYHICLYRTQL